MSKYLFQSSSRLTGQQFVDWLDGLSAEELTKLEDQLEIAGAVLEPPVCNKASMYQRVKFGIRIWRYMQERKDA